jgi:hypothetical protein
MESSAVLFHLRVIAVLRDIIYVIIILYSWHLVIYKHFCPYVWNNWSKVMHTMSTWFWHKNRVWHAGTSVASPASHPARAPSTPPDASRPAPLAAPELSRAATHCGKKQNILVKGLRTLTSMCRSNDALIRESHQQMSQRLSLLEER